MREAEKAIQETRQLLKLKKERLLKNYASTGEDAVRDSITLVESILKESGNKNTKAIDYERWHVDRGENFSLFGPASTPSVPTMITQPRQPDPSIIKPNPPSREPHHQSTSSTPKNNEDNKLKALNDILKGSTGNPFSSTQLRREDEEEFEMFIHKLNEKNVATKQVVREELRYEEEKEPEVESPVKRRGREPVATTVLDQSSIQVDYSHITGVFEHEDPSHTKLPPPPKFSIHMKQQSALEYGGLDEEVESIMSSAKKLPT